MLRRSAKRSLRHFPKFVMLADLFYFVASFSYLGYSSQAVFKEDPFAAVLSLHLILTSAALALLVVTVLQLKKIYRIENLVSLRFFYSRLSLVSVALFAAYFADQNLLGARDLVASVERLVSPPSLIRFGIVTGLLLLLHHATAQTFQFLAARGYASREIVVLGTARAAERFIEKVHSAGLGVSVGAVFEETRTPSCAATIGGVAVQGGVHALLQYARHHPLDMVVIASEDLGFSHLEALVAQIAVQPVRIGAVVQELTWVEESKAPVLGNPALTNALPGVDLAILRDVPIRGFACLLKLLLDVVVAATALVLFAPIMLVCSIGIKLTSPGPILFRQYRVGYRNKPFLIWKFRTMHAGECNTARLTVRDDPRIFKFGEILRKFSLDELPQLVNVLKGDMSLVGPRPHIPEATAAGIPYFNAVANYTSRHRVKPGITGLAQIKGWRGPTETIEQIENRVLSDLHYIDNWSIVLDLKILVKTIFLGFFGENAF